METPLLPCPDESRRTPLPTIAPHLPVVLVVLLAAGNAHADLAALSAHLYAGDGQATYLVVGYPCNHDAPAQLIDAVATSPLPVATVHNGDPLQAGQLYVVPNRAVVTVHDGNFTATPTANEVSTAQVINPLLRSVADHQGLRAILVQLSAGDCQCFAAVKKLREMGGLALQASTVGSNVGPVAGCLDPYDAIISATTLPTELLRLADGLDTFGDARISLLTSDAMQPVLTLVRTHFGYDLQGYKLQNTALRLYRRMLLRSKDLSTYYSLLQSSTGELETLSSDLLMPFTSFFRQGESWAALTEQVQQRLMQPGEDTPLRIWSAGCSTGEEAYTLAMLLVELQESMQPHVPFVLFATDISRASLLTARRGVYSATIEQELSPERLRRFFQKTPDGYRVVDELRDRCIFLNHNLCFDPPLADINLLVCLNTICYFDVNLQQQAIVNIREALAPQGICMLGHADPTDSIGDRLTVLNNESRSYTKTPTPMVSNPAKNLVQQPAMRQNMAPLAHRHMPQDSLQLQQLADALIAARFGPPGLVVDDALTIIEIRGDIAPFVKVSPGLATGKVSQLLQPALAALVATLIEFPAPHGVASRADIVLANTSQRVNVEVLELPAAVVGRAGVFLVMLQISQGLGEEDRAVEHAKASTAPMTVAPVSPKSPADASPDTSMELNEVSGCAESMGIPILLLAQDLSVRFFSPSMAEILGLNVSDIGRDASTLDWQLTDLGPTKPLLQRVLNTLQPYEQDVRDRRQHWHRIVIRPYLLAQNLRGLIILLVDINTERTLREHLIQARDFAACVLQQIPVPLAVLHADLTFRSTNAAFQDLAGATSEALDGLSLHDFIQQVWGVSADAIELHKLESLPIGGLIETEFSTRSAPGKTLVLKAQVLQNGGARVVLLVVEDVTLRRETERLLARQQSALTDQLENRDTLLKITQKELHDLAQHLFTVQEQERERIASELHDDVSQRLSLLLLACNRLAQLPHTQPETLEIDSILQQVQSLASDVRVMSHNLHPALLKQLGLVVALRALVDEFREKENLPATLSSSIGALQPSDLASTTCYRIVQEALRNVAKHAGRTHVKISLDLTGTQLRLQIRDFGNGFDQNSPFPQQGLGLTSMRERTRIAGGTFTIVSTLGEGTTIVAEVPSGVDV